MNQNYKIPASRWSLICLLLFLITQIAFILFCFKRFREGLSIESDWMLFLWLVIGVGTCLSAFRHFRTAHIISIEKDDIRIQTTVGKRTRSAETVTTVTDDQIAFHLYSKRNQISISKKKIPAELARRLDERILDSQ